MSVSHHLQMCPGDLDRSDRSDRNWGVVAVGGKHCRVVVDTALEVARWCNSCQRLRRAVPSLYRHVWRARKVECWDSLEVTSAYDAIDAMSEN